MPDSAKSEVPRPTHSASSAAMGTQDGDVGITSYMWYIHVLVSVNAAHRLRDSLAQLLDNNGTSITTPTSSSLAYPNPIETNDNSDTSGDSGSGSSSNQPSHQDDVLGAANQIDDLADYLVLDFFNRSMLETLLNNAPVEVHKGGYGEVLAGIPMHFREEFCRRLYCLLFSKYILAWPPGIAVPEPARGPTSTATSAAAAPTDNAAVDASTAGPEATAMSTGLQRAVGGGHRSPIQAPSDRDDARKDEMLFHMNEMTTDDEADDTFDGEHDRHPDSPEPLSPGYQSTPGPASPWSDTPSPGYGSELAWAAYFGTVSDPQPIQYLGDCGRSREDGPARAACAGPGSGARESHGGSMLSPLWNPRRHPVLAHVTPQDLAASLGDTGLGQNEQQASHTGPCCPCRAGEVWPHGAGAQQ